MKRTPDSERKSSSAPAIEPYHKASHGMAGRRFRNAEILRLSRAGKSNTELSRKFKISERDVADALRLAEHDEDYCFGFGTRTRNTIISNLCHPSRERISFSELASLSYSQLISIPNFGKTTVREIAVMLWREGVEMPELPDKLKESLQAGFY